MKPSQPDKAGFAASKWVGGAFVILVGLIAYANSFHGPFIFDDINAIEGNPAIRGWGDTKPGRELTSLAGRPFLRLTLMADYAAGGLNVEIYHATNVMIHLGAALTLFALIRLNLSRTQFWGDRFIHSANALAAISAAIWVAHPLNTQAVTYIIQRAESLASLFYLLTLYFFVRAAQSPANYRGWWLACVVSCLAGMATKQILVTAPLLIFLYDRTFISGSFKNALRQRWRMHLSLAATWLFLVIVVLTGEKNINTAGFNLGVSPLDYARTQLGVIAHYLRIMIVPYGQVFDYEWPFARHWSQVNPAGWLVAGLALLIAIAIWARPAAGFAGAWFFLILAPSSSFFPIITEVAAEHRVYLAMASPVVLIVVIGWQMLQAARLRSLAWPLAGATILVLTVLTMLRNADYRTAEGIWKDTLSKQPDNPRAHYNLAFSMEVDHKRSEAASEYQKTLEFGPNTSVAYFAAYHLGRLFSDLGGLNAAEPFYRKEMQAIPRLAGDGHYILGKLYAAQGDFWTAETELKASLEAQPGNVAALDLLASVRERQRK